MCELSVNKNGKDLDKKNHARSVNIYNGENAENKKIKISKTGKQIQDKENVKDFEEKPKIARRSMIREKSARDFNQTYMNLKFNETYRLKSDFSFESKGQNLSKGKTQKISLSKTNRPQIW